MSDDRRLWTSQSVAAMLGNPIYAGFVTHKGDLLAGRHEAIIPEELYRQVQRMRTSARGRPAAPTHDAYLLRTLLKCVQCGSNLQGNHTKAGAGYRYYRETARRRGIECPAPQIAIRAERLEAEVDAIVARFRMPEDVRERVLTLLREADGEEDVEVQRARIEERLRRLGRLYADLQIDEAEYEAQRRALAAQLDRLTVPVERAVAAAETFDVLQAAWAKATPDEKRSLALALFEAIYVDTATKAIVDVVVQPAFRAWLSDWR